MNATSECLPGIHPPVVIPKRSGATIQLRMPRVTHLINGRSAEKNNMYSKKLLRTYIDQALHLKGSNHRQLALALGITSSNLSRALDDDPTHNMTLPQFATMVSFLNLDCAQVMHVLTGKKEKEATAGLVEALSRRLVEQLLQENGANEIVNTRRKKQAKRTIHKS